MGHPLRIQNWLRRSTESEPTIEFWEDFESNSSRMTSLNGNSSWSIQGTGAYAGTYRLQYAGGANHSCRWDDNFVYSPSSTFLYEGWVRTDAGGTNLAMLLFGKTTGSNYNGYQVCIDSRNSTGGSAAFQIRLNNGSSPLTSSTAPTIVVGNWYKIQVEWRSSAPNITARLFNSSLDLLATLTSNNTTHTSGRLGVHGFNTTSFDNLYLEV